MIRSIQLQPIGFVENSINEMLPPGQIKQVPSRIVIDPSLTLGLTGLQASSRIIIIFHFHQAPQEYELLQHPKHDTNRPKRGIFALRSPQRPNGIGITEVELLEIEHNVLLVRDLDAINGSPVLDIKPA